MAKINNLEDLRRQKELLKIEILEKESKLYFDNPKEILSKLTNGFTENYLQKTTDKDSNKKIGLKTTNLISFVTVGILENYLKEKFTKTSQGKLGISTNKIAGNMVENAVKLGIAGFATNYAKKNLYHTSWKKKIIGLALIYLAPFLLRFLQKKLKEFQTNETLKGMDKLI